MKVQTVLLALLPSVLGHGMITTPSPRRLGTTSLDRCGAAVYQVLGSDPYGPIENSANKADSGYTEAACHLWFCKGYQLEDNMDRVKTYKPGQVVSFHIDIEARHTGRANVSVVDLASRTVIGKPLFNWPVYTNNSLGPPDWPANETDFTVTVPTDLGTQCNAAGKCAIQWWWYAYSNNQTYESCVDFII